MLRERQPWELKSHEFLSYEDRLNCACLSWIRENSGAHDSCGQVFERGEIKLVLFGPRRQNQKERMEVAKRMI